MNPTTGSLELLDRVDAGGESTCYITPDAQEERLLITNYWDSTLTTIELKEDGSMHKAVLAHDGKPEGLKRVASAIK